MAELYSRGEVSHKIVNLLRLAEKAGTKAEAETALAMAHKLMLKYAIQEHELQNQDEEVLYRDLLIYRGKIDRYEHKLICFLLREYFHVTVYTYRIPHKETCTFVFGTESNTDFAVYVHNFLCNIYKTLWQNFQKEKPYLLNSMSRSYYVGLTAGFESTLKKDLEQLEEGESTALVVIGKELQDATKQAHPNLKSTSVKFNNDGNKRFFPGVHQRGVEDGKKIKISRAIEDGTER